MKIPQQYDELKIREHYNSLKDGGMEESQIETDMLYDSPFEQKVVQSFFDTKKKKRRPFSVTRGWGGETEPFSIEFGFNWRNRAFSVRIGPPWIRIRR